MEKWHFVHLPIWWGLWVFPASQGPVAEQQGACHACLPKRAMKHALLCEDTNRPASWHSCPGLQEELCYVRRTVQREMASGTAVHGS